MSQVVEKTASDTIRAAIDNGITVIDTAQAYRTSATTPGKALKDGYRDRFFLATKVSGDYSPEGIRAAIDNSLRARNVDHVDLYQIHAPDPRYPIAESMTAMSKLQEAGRARYLGVSKFDAEQIEDVVTGAG